MAKLVLKPKHKKCQEILILLLPTLSQQPFLTTQQWLRQVSHLAKTVTKTISARPARPSTLTSARAV